MVKNMDKEYRCDIDYKIINLWDNSSKPEDRMNELAAQGCKIYSQNDGIVIMTKETYSEVTKPEPPSDFCENEFCGAKAVIDELTKKRCKGTLYFPCRTEYEEVKQYTNSFADYLVDTYGVVSVVSARSLDWENAIYAVEVLPKEEKC